MMLLNLLMYEQVAIDTKLTVKQYIYVFEQNPLLFFVYL